MVSLKRTDGIINHNEEERERESHVLIHCTSFTWVITASGKITDGNILPHFYLCFHHHNFKPTKRKGRGDSDTRHRLQYVVNSVTTKEFQRTCQR